MLSKGTQYFKLMKLIKKKMGHPSDRRHIVELLET